MLHCPSWQPANAGYVSGAIPDHVMTIHQIIWDRPSSLPNHSWHTHKSGPSWDQPSQLRSAELLSWPIDSWAMIYGCCLQPLHFGVICHTAIDNRCRNIIYIWLKNKNSAGATSSLHSFSFLFPSPHGFLATLPQSNIREMMEQTKEMVLSSLTCTGLPASERYVRKIKPLIYSKKSLLSNLISMFI